MTGAAITVVTLLVALLAELGSAVSEATVTVLVMSPPAAGITTTVKLLALPLDKVPRVQTTCPPTFTQPGEAETNATPAGKVSVSVTLDAAAGPGLVTVRV